MSQIVPPFRTARYQGGGFFLLLGALLAPALPVAGQTVTVDPLELVYEVEIGQPPPPSQTFRVESNPPGAGFMVEVDSGLISAPFVSLFPTNATTPQDVNVSINSTLGFTQPGTREVNLKITMSGSGEVRSVNMVINVSSTGEAPIIASAPPSLTFAAATPGAVPPSQQLIVQNSGGGILDYDIAVSYPLEGPQNWVQVTPPNGVLLSDGTRSHTVQLSANGGLVGGVHNAQINLTGNAINSPFAIPLTLVVGAAPMLSASPTSLTFSTSAGAPAPAAQTLTISNGGEGPLVYQIVADQPWMMVEPMAGDATGGPVTHQVSVNVDGLGEGARLGNLIVNSDDLGAPFIIPVTLTIGPPSQLFVVPSSLDFIGRSSIPSLEARSVAIVNTPLSPGRWAARVEPGHISWLRIEFEQGQVPGRLTAWVDTTGLGAGPDPLQATIVLAPEGGGAIPFPLNEEDSVIAGQDSPEIVIPVQLTVLADPPQLGVSPSAVLVQGLAQTAGVIEQRLDIENLGGPILNWESSTATDNGLGWLSFSPSSGIAPTATQVAVDTTALPAGVHHGRIQITAGGQSRTIPVTAVIAPRGPVLDADRDALYWETTLGGPAPPARTVTVLNLGLGALDWQAEVQGLTGAAWLTATTASGTARPAGVGDPSLLTLTPNVAGQPAGLYGALVEVRSTADPSVKKVLSAMLRIGTANEIPPRDVAPGGLSFVAPQAGAPLPKTIRVRRNRLGESNFQSGAATENEDPWLLVSPQVGVADADGAADVEVNVDPTGLPPGFYRGQVSVTFGDGLVETAWVTMIVPQPAAGVCEAQAIVIAPLAPHLGFRAVSARAYPLQVEVFDSCGSRVSNAAVTAWFNNGDPALALERVGSGRYSATWTPGNASSQADVIFRARSGVMENQIYSVGTVTGTAEPALSTRGVVNGASFAPGEGIAPGSIISAFGRNLLAQSQAAQNVPLPRTLGTLELLVAGAPAPLFFGSLTQVNAQAAFELSPGTLAQVIAKVGGSYSTPQDIAVASARPGLFPREPPFQDRAVAQNQDFSLNGPGNPALSGEAIVIYLAGIGAVDPAVASGGLPPSMEPFARSVYQATATIGGLPAEIFFLGMTPEFVGLVQANLVIPEGVQIGPDTPLIITVNGQPSNVRVIATGVSP